jgi:hypothetical protein
MLSSVWPYKMILALHPLYRVARLASLLFPSPKHSQKIQRLKSTTPWWAYAIKMTPKTQPIYHSSPDMFTDRVVKVEQTNWLLPRDFIERVGWTVIWTPNILKPSSVTTSRMAFNSSLPLTSLARRCPGKRFFIFTDSHTGKRAMGFPRTGILSHTEQYNVIVTNTDKRVVFSIEPAHLNGIKNRTSTAHFQLKITY